MYFRESAGNSSDFMGKLDTMSFSRICLRFSSLSSVRLVKNGRRMRAWPCEAMQTNVSHTTLWVLWLTDLQDKQNHYFLKTANSALHGSNKWLQNKFWTAPWTSLNAAMDLSFSSRGHKADMRDSEAGRLTACTSGEGVVNRHGQNTLCQCMKASTNKF